MKMIQPIRQISLMLWGSLAFLVSPLALANAGDTIANRATVNFSAGGVAQTPIESSPTGNLTAGIGNGVSTTFVEDRLVNFAVLERIGTYVNVVPGQNNASVILTFTVTNNGNAVQDFSLSALLNATDPFGGADNFDATAVQVFVDSGAYTNDGSVAVSGYVPASDTATFVDELGRNQTATVYIRAQIPIARLNGDISAHTLVAQIAQGGAAAVQGANITNDNNGNISPGGAASNIADNTATVQVVFNDPVGDLNSAGAADIARNGQHSDSGAFRVQTATLTISKVIDGTLATPANLGGVIWDPVNANSNPKAIPGSHMRYVVRIRNTGGASATLTTISDILPVTLVFDPNLIAAGCVSPAPVGPAACATVSGVAGNGVRVQYNNDGAGNERATVNFNLTTAAVIIGNTFSVDLSTVLPADVPNNYTVGELKAGESVDIMFNAVVQ
ncbi:MAG: hypothetical protein H0W44_05255 [Gammaproteobacteria bacterium]|nr:hypothetical protein [Gammaproteobacteria bacterium]